MTSIVSLDIETTGLDPQADAIIEIGAVRFNGSRIEDEFSTLINPGRHIPEFITRLTEINDEMVRQAPRLQDVLEELAAFVGDSPVLGHNVQFDLSFFRKYKIFDLNQSIDTYEMAAVLLPSASHYNLKSLAQTLGIYPGMWHRGLEDAKTAQSVFQKLFARAMELP